MTIRGFTLLAALALIPAVTAGCSHDVTAPDRSSASVAPFPTGLAALEFQAQGRALVAANGVNTLAAGRIYAALSVAQHRAVKAADAQVATDDTQPSAGFDRGGRSRFEARRGAVAGASVRVLSWFFPAATSALEQKLAEQASAAPGQVHPEFARGVAIGRSAGDALVAHVQNDGFTTPWTGTVPTGPGVWIPNALPPGGAMLGSVTPYFLVSGSQFRPAAPQAYGSAAFDTDLNEVLTLAQNITPAQLAIAKYWDAPAGSPTPIGLWNNTAAGYIAEQKLDERAATEVFALLQATMFDALISCWEAKYHYWTLRPSQANAAIPLGLPLPNFPAYPSGHSCVSSAAGRVLTHFFPNRSSELANLVSEAGVSRIHVGIHYRFDITAGYQLGNAVAEWAIGQGAL